METGVVNIRGRDYKTVALRVQEFHKDYEGMARINTLVMRNDDEKVVVRAEIRNDDQVLSTGHAEEYREASSINKKDALENAETSAVGRALAFLGYGGQEIADPEAVERALPDVDPELIQTLEEAAAMGLESLGTAWGLLTEEQRKSVGVARKDALKVLAGKSDG